MKADLERIGYKLKKKDLSLPQHEIVYQHDRKFYLPDLRPVANIILSILKG